MLDRLVAGRPSSPSVHGTSRRRGRRRSFAARGLCALLILAMSVPSSLAQVSMPEELDFEDAVRFAADRPLTGTPLRWRRGVVETLLPVAVEVPAGQRGDRVLPLALVRAIQQDNETYFLDEGHIRSAVVFGHDLQLIRRLVTLLRNPSGDLALFRACFDGLIFLILADRQMADQAVREAAQAVAAMQDPRAGIPAADVERAVAELGQAQSWFDQGLNVMRQGNAETAAAYFLKAWGYAARVSSIGGLEHGRDSDTDGIVDAVEFRLGSNPLVADTDGDGLSDHYELHRTLPYGLPASADTDGDGTSDDQEDFDGDGLTTAAERDLGTDPLLDDTDGDGIPDGEEVDGTGTDPRLADTDGDGLWDDGEVRLETDGRNPDTDGDGIADGADAHAQRVRDEVVGVTVDMVGVGDHLRRFRAHSLASHGGLGGVPGLVGDFVDLAREGSVTSARVRLRYDPESVPDGDFANLRLLRYDPVARALEVLPNALVDAGDHEVSADTPALSPVGVVHLPSWESGAMPAATTAVARAGVALAAEPRLALVEEAVPPFPRLPICGDQDGSETPLVLQCPDFEFTPGVQTYQVPGRGPVGLDFDFVFREAGYNNELGFFLVDNAAGAIGGWRPGESGYLPALLSRARVIFAGGSDASARDVHLSLRGGDMLGFFLVQDSGLSVLRQQNRFNQPDRTPLAFFSLDAVTPDGLDHFAGFRNPPSPITQFGFEDLTGGGDRDYDDVVYNVIPRLEPLTGLLGLRPLRASRTTGETQAFTATLRDGDGEPLAGQTLTFTVTGANTRLATATTGADGTAVFSYAGGQSGEDSIVARASVASSNTALVTWVSPVPADSDHDGLTDAQETAGFLTQFAYRVFTDPFRADTDGDGIADGDEVIAGPNPITPVLADPTKADTDGDGLDDFRELTLLEEGVLNSYDPDTDHDGLLDGEEVDRFSTEPLVPDTDGDGVTDGEEVRGGTDPLVPLPRTDPVVAAREFAIGALCGEFCIDDPAHANVAFFAGFLVSGTISLVPTPVTVVLGLVADLRDFFASLLKGDWFSLGINTIALIPSIGDAADAVGTMAKFLGRYPHLVFPVVLLLSKMDGLPESTRILLKRAGYGDEVFESLITRGFDVEKLLKLIDSQVDLVRLNLRWAEVVSDYPGIARYLSDIPADAIRVPDGVLKTPGFVANLRKAGAVGGDAKPLANLIGSYGEWLMKKARAEEGWEVLTAVRQSQFTNDVSYDLVAARDGFVRLIEAKAVKGVGFEAFWKYVTAVGGELRFNQDFFEVFDGFKSAHAEEAFVTGKLQIELFIDSPNAARIEQSLRRAMGVAEGRIFAKYDFILDGERVERTVEVILNCFREGA